ncbi:TonB-dependent receptor [Neokomagataea thailandica NBRC 106555]|uniref:TonB-dependent receptor n=1 Tax=Neokomagataea thailandica NBRC 106555 TaxID=1223520 RepID=A0ABQ0QQN4_9PROT|nr:TonB-dependent receptor [Neokomagataea thailandica]GBR53447.1 TonB-dependent receptor [Neokomagataea thailandica NBRC 106555]
MKKYTLLAATTLASFQLAYAAKKTVDASHRVEQISVTASAKQRAAHTIDRKTRELQNVPQAATRVDARQLKAEHITNLTQATRLLPTVQFNIANPRVSAINIRGLGAAGTGATDGIEGGVAVYVDGVYRPRPATAMSDLPGLNGITVLRGPSGTTGGMVTTAGAIEITTTAPDLNTRHVSAEAGAGNYNYNRWAVGLSTPLIRDKLAVRVDALGYAYSGWVRNLSGGGDINGVTNRSVRAQVLYRPTDEIDVRVIGDYNHLRENCCSGSLYKITTQKTDGTVIGGNLLQRAAWSHYTPVEPSDTPYTINRDSLSQANQEDMGLSAQANWHHAGFVLSSITAYRAWNWWPLNDGDLNGVNAQTNTNIKVNQRQFSQEFRFVNHWGKLLDYRLGAYYLWQENAVAGDQAYGSDAGTWLGYGTSASPVAGVTAAQAGNALNGYNVRSYAQPTTNYYALYTDGTWHLSKQFDVVTGVRYNYGVKTGSFAQWQVIPASYSSAITPLTTAQKIWNVYGANSGFSGHLDNGFVTGQIALQYHVTQNLMLYGRYARGGKSGGLNLTPLSVQQIASGAVSPNVGKETDDAFEVGTKLTALQGRLLFAGALYQTNDHNYQVTAVREFQGSLLSYLSSAPKVRIRGAEADVHYSPLPNLITTLSASYNDAQFLEYSTVAPPEVVTSGIYSLAHTQVPFVPRWAFSASAQYYHTVGKIGRSLADAYLGGSYNYNTRENTSANNSVYGWVPGYGTLNVNFGLRDHQGRWDVSGFINNATDERRISQVVQGSGVSGNGAWYAYVTQPRNFGFIARVNY